MSTLTCRVVYGWTCFIEAILHDAFAVFRRVVRIGVLVYPARWTSLVIIVNSYTGVGVTTVREAVVFRPVVDLLAIV